MQWNLLMLATGPARSAAEGMARGGPGGFPGGFLLGGLMSVLWTVLIVLLVLWVTQNWSKITGYFQRTATSLKSSTPTAVQAPLEIAQTRYAKGEISRAEYETLRRDLAGEPLPAPEPTPTVAETPSQA
ncbi:MAG: SHOCT domain-containing protein [Caldilineaceae bacterium]|nr:SHOCT domain-containing protein [Caldilineaceae bacterium]